MTEIKLKFDNLLTAIEYIQANTQAEIVTLSDMEKGEGVQISFTDRNGKQCVALVYTGAITPEVVVTTKIYRKK